MKNLLLKQSRATPQELAVVLWSFAYFFALLAGYYVLRPIRDEMGLQLGARVLQELFTAVFAVMLLLVPAFNVLPPEQKYKAKNVIDTLVRRTGDTASGWIFSGLRGPGLSGVQISWLSVPIAAGWVAIAWSLGRQAETLQSNRGIAVSDNRAMSPTGHPEGNIGVRSTEIS